MRHSMFEYMELVSSQCTENFVFQLECIRYFNSYDHLLQGDSERTRSEAWMIALFTEILESSVPFQCLSASLVNSVRSENKGRHGSLLAPIEQFLVPCVNWPLISSLCHDEISLRTNQQGIDWRDSCLPRHIQYWFRWFQAHQFDLETKHTYLWRNRHVTVPSSVCVISIFTIPWHRLS